MSGLRKYQLIKKNIVKFEKNIINIPEVFGRVIVAVSPYQEYLNAQEYLLAKNITEICEFV